MAIGVTIGMCMAETEQLNEIIKNEKHNMDKKTQFSTRIYQMLQWLPIAIQHVLFPCSADHEQGLATLPG